MLDICSACSEFWKHSSYYEMLSFSESRRLHLIADMISVEIAGRVQVLDNGDLLIAAVKSNDAGKYTCIRANEAGSINGSAYLTVMGNY